MKPLLLTICCLVGIFLLLPIFTWLAAFKPLIIAFICILGLLALSIADNWRHYAASIDSDETVFGAASANAEMQPLINDPVIGGSDKSNTTTGGGVTSRRPLRKISTPENRKHNSTKCIKTGSTASVEQVG